ncbi:probable methyltransferase TARBP1 [Dendronephthya gigantea]|uniref:probable methyltransferase TARBP1 n=1 Tax=Dendronephthya gigantea TaxID=151771 RepID=UPI001069C279|nr:probable methyltransferase TARBP1 [Dendronephthya gigantea]
MAARSLVEHLLRLDDIKYRKANILDYLSTKWEGQVIDCDYLESLNVIVSHLLNVATNRSNTANTEVTEPETCKFGLEPWIKDALKTILTETCIPTLSVVRPTGYDTDKRDRMRIFELTYELVAKIVCRGPLENAHCIWSLVLKSLQNFVDECNSGFDIGHGANADESLLQVATALDLLAYLLDTIDNWKEDRLKFAQKENSEKESEEAVLHYVLNVLNVVENEGLLFKITGRILPKLLSINELESYRDTKIIWESVKVLRLQEQEECHSSSGFLRSYAIVSSLADLYFKRSGETVFKIHQDPAFWSMIQAGLVNNDSLVRKRSLYLLQRVIEMCKEQQQSENVCLEQQSTPVFWWNIYSAEEILNIWQQYVFLLETLEEKQLHVIQPVLPRIDELVNATKKTKDISFPLLHVSWLSVIVHRAAIHENRFIKKWGVMTLLTLNFHEVPFLQNKTTRNFTCDTFIMLLKEPTLYAKNHGESKSEPSALSSHLLKFFKKCLHAVNEEEKTGFFAQVFTSISRYNISHVPLTFIVQSLSNVPRISVFGSELLSSLRSIISNMLSHSVILRGAVKTFLLRTFMNFVNPVCVRVYEVLVFLGSFAKEESLCRGTHLWNEVTLWLSESHLLFQSETSVFFLYVDRHVRSFLKNEYSNKTREAAVGLAKFILLCYDSSAITRNEINQLFQAIFLTISKAQSNVYQPVSNCWQAVELLHGLLHELLGMEEKLEVADDLTTALMVCLQDILECLTQTLVRTIGQEDEYASYHGYSAYYALLDKVKSLWLSRKFPEKVCVQYQIVLNKLADLGLSLWDAKTECTTVKHWLCFLVSSKLNIWVIQITDATDFVLTNERKRKFLECVWLSKFTSNLAFPNEGKCQNGSCLKEESWRVISEDIITTKWHSVNLAISESNSKAIPARFSLETFACSSYSDIVKACVEALSLISGSACYSCLETLRLCLPYLFHAGDEDTIILLLKTTWSVLNEIRTRYSGYFWPALDIVVKIIFAPELLNLPSDSLFTPYVRKYWESLLAVADDQTGLVTVAVANICHVLSGMYHLQSFEVTSLDYHVDIIADICLFGPVHKKDLKLLFDTAAYVKSLGKESGVINRVKFKECECESARVRVDLLAFLLSVDYNEEINSLFLVKLIRALLERDEILSKVKASRFLNSENHRKKQRLWQIILTLVSRITDEEFALEFCNRVLKALEGDNQTSVRFFMELSLVRLFFARIHLLETIWVKMKDLYKTRLGFVASLISILTHVFLTLEEQEYQMIYLQRLIPAVIPCAFLNHSQIRAYILATLEMISNTCSEVVWSEIIFKFPVIQSCLLFKESVVEGDKEKNRLQKDRDLFSLHPIYDFSIEMIFKTVPLITGVVDDEIVAPEVFQNEGSKSWIDVIDLPLCGRNHRSPESGSENTLHELSTAETTREKAETSCASSMTSDVQKKITPWNVIAPPQEGQDSFDDYRQRPVERRVGDLIVVASLIDRAPNLGGLCRTCEIFGASKLILGSKHVVSEKDFKSVSVSSEKWVDFEEVKIHDLVHFLLKMKREGFTIVGVEQTAQSKKLTDFQFPYSTVLVLGNEKAGIPVEIIQLLDECVEIPQHGIIRSLNVHVSGALLIWEYSRQHLSDK